VAVVKTIKLGGHDEIILMESFDFFVRGETVACPHPNECRVMGFSLSEGCRLLHERGGVGKVLKTIGTVDAGCGVLQCPLRPPALRSDRLCIAGRRSR
jgi:hypothetical protein